jgi:hypothetical protein
MSLRKYFQLSVLVATAFVMVVSSEVGTQHALGASLPADKKSIGGVVTTVRKGRKPVSG